MLEEKVRDRTKQLKATNNALKIETQSRRRTENALRLSERKFRSLFENANAAILLLEKQFCVGCNKKALELFGCAREEIIGQSIERFWPHAQTDGKASALEGFEKIELALEGIAQSFEWRYCRLEGTPFDTIVSLNRIEFDEKLLLQSIIHDISVQKKFESLLKESEERYRTVVENSNDGICLAKGNKFLYVNQRHARMFGYGSPEELIGKPDTITAHPLEKDRIRKYTLDRQKGEPAPSRYEFRGIRKDGSPIDIEASVTSTKYDGSSVSLAIVRDITERKRLEKTILELSDKGNFEIGTYIHDVLGQYLTGIAVMSKAIEERLEQSCLPEMVEAKKLKEVAYKALEITHNIARSVYPMGIEEGGICASLQELAMHVQNMFNVSCSFRSNRMNLTMDKDTSVHLYRIAQEAINNAVKHSKASAIIVGLYLRKGRVTLSVRDNGIGFPQKLEGGKGMGLQIMKYRSKLIGASFEIRSSQGSGATVRCSLGLRDEK